MSTRPWRVEIKRHQDGEYRFDCCCASRDSAKQIAIVQSGFWGYGWRIVNRDTGEVFYK